MAFRALLFAVFGGFIGAAPAALPAGGGAGHGGCMDARAQTQRLERPAFELSTPTTPCIAAAPPCSGGAPAAAIPPASAAVLLLAAIPASAPVRPGRPVPPPSEDVRAGLLDLPPPAR